MLELRTDYLDLALIHWPGVKGVQLNDVKNAEQRKKTYAALESLHLSGLIRCIGVSNYTSRHLKELFDFCTIRPHLLQVRTNHFFAS